MKRLPYLVAGFLSLAMPASAATIDTQSILRSFGTIALGDFNFTGADTEAAVLVGGNFSSPNFNSITPGATGGTVGGQSGTVLIGGNATAPNRVDVNINQSTNGGVVIGGNNNANFNINGGTPADRPRIATGFIDQTALREAFVNLSRTLSELSTTDGAARGLKPGTTNNLTLTSGAGSNGLAVLNESDPSFLTGQNMGLSLNDDGFSRDTGVTFIVNVAGQNITINTQSNPDDGNVIFNFFEAETITVDSTFGFGILAPLATVNLNGGGTDTFVLGNTVNQVTEVRGVFTGTLPGTVVVVPEEPQPAPVPLPAAAFLLLAGLGGLGALRATRRA